MKPINAMMRTAVAWASRLGAMIPDDDFATAKVLRRVIVVGVIANAWTIMLAAIKSMGADAGGDDPEWAIARAGTGVLGLALLIAAPYAAPTMQFPIQSIGFGLIGVAGGASAYYLRSDG